MIASGCCLMRWICSIINSGLSLDGYDALDFWRIFFNGGFYTAF